MRGSEESSVHVDLKITKTAYGYYTVTMPFCTIRGCYRHLRRVYVPCKVHLYLARGMPALKLLRCTGTYRRREIAK